MSDHHDDDPRQGLDEETFFAWGKLVFELPGITKGPPNFKEIARLLRLKKTIPPVAQDWLADLFDPPSDGYDEYHLVLGVGLRAEQRLETLRKNINITLEIAKAMDRGLTRSEAIEEIMPGQKAQAYRILKTGEGWLKMCSMLEEKHPGILERIVKSTTGKK